MTFAHEVDAFGTPVPSSLAIPDIPQVGGAWGDMVIPLMVQIYGGQTHQLRKR